MLETIRSLAAELLDASPPAADDARRAHLAHWIRDADAWAAENLDESRLDDFNPPDAALLADLDNRRAALTYGITSDGPAVPVLAIQVAVLVCPIDAREALERVDAAAAAEPDELGAYWLAFCRLGILWTLGRAADIEEPARRLVPVAARLRPGRVGWVVNFVAIAAWRTGRLADAEAALVEALALTEPEDGPLRTLLFHNRGLVAADQGDIAATVGWFERARDAAAANTVMRVVLDLRLGHLALERGRVDEAIAWLTPVLDAAGARPVTHAMAVEAMVRALIAHGDVDAALDLAERTYAGTKDALTGVIAGAALGQARVAGGDLAGAEAVLDEADAIAVRAAEADHRRGVTFLLGRVRRLRGDFAGARAAFTELVDLSPVGAVESQCELASMDDDRWVRLAGVLRPLVDAGLPARAAIACAYAADAAVEEGRLELAATLLGAADSFRSRGDIDRRVPGSPGDAAEAATVGFDDARRAGRALSPDEVVALVEGSSTVP